MSTCFRLLSESCPVARQSVFIGGVLTRNFSKCLQAVTLPGKKPNQPLSGLNARPGTEA